MNDIYVARNKAKRKVFQLYCESIRRLWRGMMNTDARDKAEIQLGLFMFEQRPFWSTRQTERCALV